MIALSVILMCSGQTSVQHLVMLQKPIPPLVLEVLAPVGRVDRVHLEPGDPHEEARAHERLLGLVVAQHVADVLAQEALDALAELLDAVDVLLLPAPVLLRTPSGGVNGAIAC